MAAVVIDAALGSSVAQTTPANFTLNFATSTGTPGVGDLIVVCCTIRGSAGTLATPSGWTAVTGNPFQNTGSNVNRMYLFYRVRQAADANSVSFVVSGGATNNTLLAQAYNFGGVDDTTPIEVAAVKTDSGAATSATLAGPLTGLTSLNNDALAVAFWHRADDAGTFSTASSGWVHASFTNAVVASALGTDASMGMASKRLASAGASGTYQVNVAAGAAAAWLGVVLIVKQQTGTGLISLDAENWADEASITSQSATDPYVAIVVGTGTTKADSAWSKVGTKSYRNSVAAQQQRFKINTVRPDTEQYGATIYRTSQLPSASTRIASLEGYDGTDWLQVQHQSTGAWRIAADGGSPFSAASTTLTPINTPVRLEYWYDGFNGTGELRIFQGADIDNDINSYTDRVTLTGMPANGVVGRSMYGPGVANFSGADIWYDLASIRRGTWVNLSAGTTVLTKTFDLAWNLRSLVTDTVATAWNLRSIVSQSAATAWNLRSLVSQSAATSWNLRSLVTKSQATAFNILGRVTDTIDTAWNIRSVVTKSQATAWNLYSAVSKTAATAWNVVGRVTQSAATAWNIRQVVTKSQATAFNILNALLKTQTTSWNLRQLVSQSASTSWNIRSLVTQSKAVAWNIIGRVTDTVDTSWNIRTALSKSQATAWNIRQLVSQSSATSWNVRSIVTKSQASAWNIVGRVVDTADVAWNVIGRVVDTVDTAWNVRQVVTKSQATAFNILNLVSKTQATAWNLRQIVSQSSVTSWNIRSLVTQSKAVAWNITGRITVSQASSWNIRQIISQSAATSWNIRSIVSKTQATAWNIRQVITKTADTAWNVLTIGTITKAFDIAWNVREILTKSQASSWNIRNALLKTQATAWNIRFRLWATNYNRVPGFEHWNLVGGATVDGAGVLTLPTVGANAYIKIPWDGSVDPNFYLSAESMAANFETEPTFAPFTGVHYGSGYLDANDQPTANSQPNTGNGFAGKTTQTSLGVWATRVQWGAPGLMAPGGKYLVVIMYCSTAYTGAGVQYRNPMLTAVSHGSGTPYVPVGFNLAWNLRELVTKSTPTAWNLRSLVSKSVATAWNIVGRVTQSVATAWNLRSIVTKSQATAWNLRQIVTQSAATAWNLRSIVTKTAATAWNLRQIVSQSAATAWNLRSIVTKSASTAWNLREIVSKSQATSWNLRQLVFKTADTQWNIQSLGAVTKSFAVAWNLREILTKQSATSWNLRETLSKQTTTAWNIRTIVTRAQGSAWAIRNAIAQVTSTSWNIRTLATKSINTSWNLQGRTTKNVTIAWVVLERAQKNTPVSWHVLNALEKQVVLAWNIAAPIFDTAAIEFNGNVIVVAIFGTDSSVEVEHPLNGVEAEDDLYGSVITESDVLKILGGDVKVGD